MPCVIIAAAHAQTAVIDVGPDLESIDLAPVAYRLEDAEGTLTLADVQGSRAAQFELASTKTGASPSAFWWRFTLRNTTGEALQVRLDTGNKRLREVDLYVTDAAGSIQHQSSGALQKFVERPLPTPTFVFPITLSPAQSVDVFLRVRSYGLYPVSITPQLLRAEAHQQQLKLNTAHWLAYLGLVVGLTLFNLFLFFFTRDANFLFYVLAQVSMAWFVSGFGGQSGSLYEYFWPNSPRWENTSVAASSAVAIGFVTLFITHFVELRRQMPRMHKVTWIVAGTGMLCAAGRAVALAFDVTSAGHVWQAVLGVQNGTALVQIIIWFAALVQMIRSGQRSAQAMALAWTPLIIAIVFANVAQLMGRPVSSAIMIGASAIELVLMSLILADRFNQEMRNRERLGHLRRFFSPAVADRLLADNFEDFLKPRRREIVVVFVDLRGYTAFTDTHEADEVMRVLGEFHEAMGEIIMAHGGTLERFAGDGLMIFFNDPIEISDPAQHALAMAVAMQKCFAELQALWEIRGYTLAMGIGIAQGVATLGAIGFEGRRDYGAIGGVTNLAARLCGEAKGGQILVSETVARNAAQTQALCSIGKLALKGFGQEQEAYEWVQEPSS